MRLLVDTDAFCKLAVGGVLHDAITLLGADLSECGRLAALPHMLRRGRLRKAVGPEACDTLISVTNELPVAIQPSDTWLDRLTPFGAIDPGEAQIFAAAAETGLIVVSGDKRALRVLKDIAGFPEALSGRIVVLEAILLALCDRLGPDEVRRRIHALIPLDTMVKVSFSTGNPDPREALHSYFTSLTAELAPLVLWDPRSGGDV
jgi:hypothetical protein